MAYIGRDIEYGSLTRQVLTGVNGSTTVFTLDQSVGDATNLLLSIGGVIQEPNVAFTAIATTLTFTAAPTNGAIIWIVYLGKEVLSQNGTSVGSVNYQTGVGDATTTPITLSNSVVNTSEILVALNGVAQVPDTEYTVSGTTLTFAVAPAGGVVILVYYFGVAGLMNVVNDNILTASSFAGSGTLPAWNGNALTNLDATALTGALPSIDGSNITGAASGTDTTSANDPLVTTNPGTGVGTLWLNSSSGELYCCTSATTNDNVWINVGGGSGNIQAPTNPNDTFPDLSESATTNFTFAGGTDDDGTVTHYMVDQISNTSLLGVTVSEVAAGSAHSFVTQAVGSDTSVTFRVRTKDNSGLYSPGITVTTIIQDNQAPTNATNSGAFADMNESTSYNYTFEGATDADGSVTHYLVDQISNAALTVSTAEVAATTAHTFNAGAVGSDTAVTFRVRAKDNDGTYSTGVTVSMDVLELVYTQATVTGQVTTAPDGDYTVHTFTGSGNFIVTALPANANASIQYLVVAGGGGGASSPGAGAPGGGAGGMRYNTSYNYGLSVQNYPVQVGTGGIAALQSTYTSNVLPPNGTGTSPNHYAPGGKGGNSSFATITATGGGGGGRRTQDGPPGSYGGNTHGGSGGGGGWHNNGFGTGNTPSASPSQGNDGGTCPGGGGGAGGGGHSQSGGSASTSSGAAGGNGTTWNNVTYAGGGGGGSNGGSGGGGGTGGGGNGAGMPPISNSSTPGDNGKGGGGGGGGWSGGNINMAYGAVGGSGVVIIRYKFQN
jgi:hypothetical protein